MKKNNKIIIVTVISLLIVLLLTVLIKYNSKDNLYDDYMIKYSDDTIFYIPEFEFLSFDEVKNQAEYILYIPIANSKDVRHVDNIIKIDDKNRIREIVSLFSMDSKKDFKEDDVIDLTVYHPVVFIKVHKNHYFRIDVLGDYYEISQDNVVGTGKYYNCSLQLKEQLHKLLD